MNALKCKNIKFQIFTVLSALKYKDIQRNFHKFFVGVSDKIYRKDSCYFLSL